ncbi:hypothetical protein K402DRAFT_332103 [Aulographum hederae CBS 113979]|uniref:Uncharacterized protein n=1 Tax=Aulographum hederae CBS 113979 TaxID=1176131 RepID=A0A6G1H111_9PEZI|nr:hypothetical protein K402DRAFT_332103 [Aulographum hederae CBS 113979]
MDSELDSPIRKRPLDTTQTTQSKKNNTGLHQKYQSSREAILAARDLIVIASQLSHERAEQSSLLNLFQIFREFTEKGQVRYASSIIASQVATLENISKRIDNQTKTHKPAKPAQSPQPTPSPQQPVQLQQAKPSYAQVASPRTGETGKSEWTTVQKKTKPQGPNQRVQALRSRQLILIKTVQSPISPLRIKDAINNAFGQKGVEHKVIASVSLSKTNQNIILTTMQSFTGQYLLDQRAIWEKEISFSTAQLNQSWFKVC